MRFHANGPAFPDDLLLAQDEGRVIFFCGSGVSSAMAGLPGFAGLAEKVLDHLKVHETSDAFRVFQVAKKQEADSGVSGLLPADRIFSLLARDFEPRHVNEAVSVNLAPQTESPDLTAHKVILKLARNPSGHTKLVTTNFDRLFEAAAPKLSSHTRSSLPRVQFAGDDWGIVHLHGRVAKDYSGPDQDGFVLSSAEFGDAYLAQGWAREFVRDVLDRYIAVFVGYSADDPPMRYLLEGLQQSRGHKNRIFAFQAGPNDEAVSQWHEKGVVPVVFNAEEGFGTLWESLDAWAGRASDPIKWRSKVFSLARRGPAKLAPYERGMLAHIVSSTSGALAFRKVSPPLPAEWLCVFDPAIRFGRPESEGGPFTSGPILDPYSMYALDNDDPPRGKNETLSSQRPYPPDAWDAFAANDDDKEIQSIEQLTSARGFRAFNVPQLSQRLVALGEWLAKVSDQPAAVWWAAKQVALHPFYIEAIKRSIAETTESSKKNILKEAWQTVFQILPPVGRDYNAIFTLERDIERDGWSHQIAVRYADILSPKLKSDAYYTGAIPPKRRRRSPKRSMVYASVGYPKDDLRIKIPDKFLKIVVGRIRENVEGVATWENSNDGWLDLAAIEADPDRHDTEFFRSHSLSGYVLFFVELFNRLVEVDIDAAKAEFHSWLSDDHVSQRLRVWAAGKEKIAQPDELSEIVLKFDREDFWDSRHTRDILVCLARRWEAMSESSREALEKRLLRGPKSYRKVSRAENKERSARLRLNRLHWLSEQGCDFSFDLDRTTSKLREDAPMWETESASQAAASLDGGSGWVRTDTSWEVLKKVPLKELTEQADRLREKRTEMYTNLDPFRGISAEAPLRALSALSWDTKRGRFSADAWESFFERDNRKSDLLRLKILIAGRMSQLSVENFSEILLTASRWYERAGPDLRRSAPPLFHKLWNHFLSAIRSEERAGRSALVRQADSDVDWVSEAINSPSGNLAQFVMADPARDHCKAGNSCPDEWLSRINELLALPGDPRRYALVILAYNLGWLFVKEPEWTDQTFLQAMERDSSIAHDREAIWAGFLWGASAPHLELYLRLEPKFRQLARERSLHKRRHGEVLSGLLLNGWISRRENGARLVTDDNMRAVLLDAGEDFRSQALFHVETWAEENAGSWNEQLVEFITNVWPKQVSARSPRITARLVELAFQQEENFSDVVQAVLPLVSKLGTEHVLTHSFIRPEGSSIRRDPKMALELLHAVLPNDSRRWPYGTSRALTEVVECDPSLKKCLKYIELKNRLDES